MQCHNCGKENANGAKFCKYCGTSLPEKQEVLETAEKQEAPKIPEGQEAPEAMVEQGAAEAVEKQESPEPVEEIQTTVSEESPLPKIQGVEYEAVEPNRSSAESKEKPEDDRKEEKVEAKKGKTSPIVLISAAVSLVVLLLFALFFASSGSGINLNKYMSIETEGYEGYGKAKVSIDWEEIEKKYASKLSFTEAARDEYGMFISMMSPVEILRENVHLKIDKSSALSNGDKVSYTWDINEERINKYVKCKLKWKDGEHKVSSLQEVGTMDAFEKLELQFSGIAPNGEAVPQYHGNGVTVYDFQLDKNSGLVNGDIVTVSISEDSVEKFVENYGMVPNEMKKQYTVSGLDKYVDRAAEIDAETLKSLQAQAWDEYQELMADWSSEASLESFNFIGTYLLTNKSKDAWEQNRLYLVYLVKSRINYSGSSGSFNKLNDVYWFISFPNLLLKADGKVEVDDILNGSMPLSRFYVDSGLSNGWFDTLKWYYYGFDSLESLYKSEITRNLSTFNHEDKVDETTVNQNAAADSTSENSATESGTENTTVTETATTKISRAGSAEYLLSDSDSRLIGREDLINLTPEECKIARNEIYARHGRKFKDAGLQAYFESCPWYTGRIEPDAFADSYLSEVEKKNRDTIVAFEQEMGYNKH